LFGVFGVMPAEFKQGVFVCSERFQELDPCSLSPSVTRATN